MLEGNRNEWRRSEKAGYNLLSIKRLDYAEFKRKLRKRAIRGVPGDVNSRECETCGRALLSKAGYVNHVKSHASSQAHIIHASLPPRPQGQSHLSTVKQSLQVLTRTKDQTHGCT